MHISTVFANYNYVSPESIVITSQIPTLTCFHKNLWKSSKLNLAVPWSDLKGYHLCFQTVPWATITTRYQRDSSSPAPVSSSVSASWKASSECHTLAPLAVPPMECLYPCQKFCTPSPCQSGALKAMLDFAQMWVKAPILYFVIRASRQNWLCSRASQQVVALCKQLDCFIAQLHFISHRAQIGATDAGPGNCDNQFWIFHTYPSLDRLLFHMQFDLFN